MFRRGPGRLEMCFYAYKNVLEPMGHLGANLIFSILTLNQVPIGDLALAHTCAPSCLSNAFLVTRLVADTLEASCRFKRVASKPIFLFEKVIFLKGQD